MRLTVTLVRVWIRISTARLAPRVTRLVVIGQAGLKQAEIDAALRAHVVETGDPFAPCPRVA
jgi:hypothetical protein